MTWRSPNWPLLTAIALGLLVDAAAIILALGVLALCELIGGGK